MTKDLDVLPCVSSYIATLRRCLMAKGSESHVYMREDGAIQVECDSSLHHVIQHGPFAIITARTELPGLPQDPRIALIGHPFEDALGPALISRALVRLDHLARAEGLALLHAVQTATTPSWASGLPVFTPHQHQRPPVIDDIAMRHGMEFRSDEWGIYRDSWHGRLIIMADEHAAAGDCLKFLYVSRMTYDHGYEGLPLFLATDALQRSSAALANWSIVDDRLQISVSVPIEHAGDAEITALMLHSMMESIRLHEAHTAQVTNIATTISPS